MTIREIAEKDMEEYLAMSAEFYSSPAVLHDIPAEFRKRAFEQFLEGGLAKCFIFECGGAPAGYGVICFYYSQEAGGRCVIFDEIFVKPEYRSQGFGKAFFDFVFKNYPAPRYLLEIEPENVRARSLYERLGFAPLGYIRMIKDNNK